MIDLADIKRNLNMDIYDQSEDNFLAPLIEPAIEVFSADCNRTIYKSQTEYDADSNKPSNAFVLTPAMDRALIMLICHWFNNRESHTDIKLTDTPMGYQHIVDRNRVTPC